MYYIKLTDDKQLETTVWEPIYRGDHLNTKITYLIPLKVDDIDMLTAAVYLNFLRTDGEPDVVLMERQEERYKEEYFQYRLPLTCKLSRYPGEVVTWIQIFTGPASDPVTCKSGENVIRIHESRDMDTYIGDWRADKQLTALYQMKRLMDDDIARVDGDIATTNEAVTANAEQIGALWAEKADSIVYDAEDNSVQLTANGEPIGAKAYLNTYDGVLIREMRLTTDGELVVFFNDGTYENLGKVVGDDGKVYVPHIDDHKILTWTIEDAPGGTPDPVDLNPEDEWSGIKDDVEGKSDYVWDGI